MTLVDAGSATVRTRAGFAALADEWDSLQPASQNPLFSHRWFAAAAEAFHDDGNLHVVTLRCAGRLVAAAPFAVVARGGVRRLEIIGSSTLHEPATLLATDEVTLGGLCRALVALCSPIVLQRVAVGSGVSSGIREAAGKGAIVIAASGAPCLRVDNPGSWDAYLGGRSADVRGGMRRKRALLERQGPVRFETLQPTPQDLPDILGEAYDVEADGWKSASGSALRSKAALGHFVTQLAARFAATGQLRVNFLRAGGSAVAMAILLEQACKLWEIKIGYREAAARASPGRLLLWETLRDGFGRGMLAYEFLGSGDRQQPNWATGRTDLESLACYPLSVRGIGALVTDAAAAVSRKLRR